MRSEQRLAIALMVITIGQITHAETIDQITGVDDGFGGTNGATSAPGDPYINFRSPSIGPASYADGDCTDVATLSPWTPYHFTFTFDVDTTSMTDICSAEFTVQTGSVANRTDGSGFGLAGVHASVDGDVLELDLLLPESTGEGGSAEEESVKAHVFDVAPLLSPGNVQTISLVIDGTGLAAPADLFAIDYARLVVDGGPDPNGPCPTDIDDDDQTGVNDLLALLGSWGQTGCSASDFDGDLVVDVIDLLQALGAWGPCP